MKTGFRSRVSRAFGALVTAFLLVVPSIGAQQGGTVTGRVLDSRSGLPVAAAQVFISALDVGGLTQQNGRYLMQNIPAGTHTLSVTRIGYRTEEAQISVGGGQTVEQNFAMAEEALALDEIIVTGTPGGTQRRAIGNSVVSINAADIVAVAPVSNMQELLSGRTPGLQFTRRTGNVGSGSGIRIRGIGSFALHTNPLIYIDGIRVNNSTNAGPRVEDGGFEGLGGSPSAQNKGTTSVLDDLNPDDIERHRDHQGAGGGDALRNRSVGRCDPDHHQEGRTGRHTDLGVYPLGLQLHDRPRWKAGHHVWMFVYPDDALPRGRRILVQHVRRGEQVHQRGGTGSGRWEVLRLAHQKSLPVRPYPILQHGR